MSYYQHHVFFCTNLRDGERQSCDQCGAQKARDYVKQRCKELGLSGEGKVRINNAGCLDRCEQGPVVVIYPEEIGTPTLITMIWMRSSKSTCSRGRLLID